MNIQLMVILNNHNRAAIITNTQMSFSKQMSVENVVQQHNKAAVELE